MNTQHMIERNRRDLLKQMGYVHFADALDKVFPIEAEAGVPPQIQAHTLAEQQNPAKAREMAVIAGRAGVGRSKAFGDEAWTGYSEENWSWPDMIGSEGMAPSGPLVSRGECVEVGQEQFHGSQLAAEIRQACNKLTAEEREEALAHGMRLIYGGQCAASRRRRSFSVEQTGEPRSPEKGPIMSVDKMNDKGEMVNVGSTALFALGQHLFTRDGRIVGNAIVTEVTPEGLIRMETDFGNGGSLLNANEVHEWWHTTDSDGNVRISDVKRWREDRSKCQANASGEPRAKRVGSDALFDGPASDAK